MRQSQKSELTYNRILNASIEEFGTKSFELASVNNICSNNKIPKGLIYHNFKNKNELYLACVQCCFKELTKYISTLYISTFEGTNMQVVERINHLLELRKEFFMNNPYFSNIFFYSLFQPPAHLIDEIKEIRKNFDDFNTLQCQKIINSLELRDDITSHEAVEFFFIFQEMLNGYFQKRVYENANFESLVIDHELKLSKILNIFLYGISKETYYKKSSAKLKKMKILI